MPLKQNCRMVNDLLESIIPKYHKTSMLRFSSINITPSQAEILFLLEERGQLMVSEIAGQLDMVNSNVSNICSRLKRAGYIERRRQKEDQRIVKIGLTDQALPKLEKLKVENALFYQKMNQLISEEDIADICTGLEKLDCLMEKLMKIKQNKGEFVNESRNLV